MADIDPDKLKRDAKGNILRSELLRINKPALRKLDERQRRTIVRWLRGKEYWNTWANDMLARRKALEDKGKWQVSKICEFDRLFEEEIEKGESEETGKWLKDARAFFPISSFSGLMGKVRREVVKQPLERRLSLWLIY